MNYCSKCGEKLEEGSKFCSKCGTLVENVAQNAVTFVPMENSNKTNPLAITGFVISLVSFLCCGYCSIVGLIFSIIGLSQINKNNGKGRGLAIAGIVLSSVGLLVLIILSIFGYSTAILEEMEDSFDTAIIMMS